MNPDSSNNSNNNNNNNKDKHGTVPTLSIPVATTSVAPTPPSSSQRLDVILKPEYVLDAPHPCLAPLPTRDASVHSHGHGHGHGEESTQSSSQKQKRNRHKKNIKNTQKRGRDEVASTLSDLKMCKQFMVGKECPFGEECKYSHDMKELLSMREDDIPGVKGGCPHYRIYGQCPYGVACRVGGEHLNLATGQNLTKEVQSESGETVKNNLDYSVLISLRKNTYPFVCQRHKKRSLSEGGKTEEKKNDSHSSAAASSNSDNHKVQTEDSSVITTETTKDLPCNSSADQETTQPTMVDLSPLPKTKKIIDFRNKVYVAPLTTVGNLPFRRIMKKYGADITCGEMAVATNLLQGKAGEWALLKRHKDEDVFGVQIAAPYADVYERISEVIKNENIEIDFLDMNLGCPIDVICQTGAGAKLMLRDHTLRDAVKGMGKNLDCPITIKIRTGWDESKPFAHKLVPKIQQWAMGNVGAVMVHGRSRLQRYSKLADWDYIQTVAQAQSSSHVERLPIIGNGDIFSYVDYEEKVLGHEALSPTAMIGRGALIKPWLPIEIKERRHWDISATERLDILKDFVSFGLEHWGSDSHGVNNTRRFLLEWLSFLHRYIPVGLLEVSSIPQEMNQRPPRYMCGRSDLETLMMSNNSADWIKISEMLLGPVREGFEFEPKHKANSYK